jgi:hypothetical protein
MTQATISFHNTISLDIPELIEAEKNAKNQEEKILFLFRTYNEKMTPSEVYKRYQLCEWPPVPITSCRRAMSNLTRAGRLEMLEEMKDGIYGVKEHFWKLK